MKRLHITPDQLIEILAKYPGCATIVKETHYRISMSWSKQLGPPFLCAGVDIKELRDGHGLLVCPVVAEFQDDDSFKFFAPAIALKPPDGYVKCPKPGCSRWMGPGRVWRDQPDKGSCWTCLDEGFTDDDVLEPDWTPPFTGSTEKID